MKTNHQKVLVIVEIALLTALAVIFDLIANLTQIQLFPNGGSISISMLPVFVLAYRRGLIPGLVSGLLLGTLQTILGVTYYLFFLQFLLDYTLAYGLVGFAGVFFKWVQSNNNKYQIIGIISGTILGGFLRYFSHVLSGVIYWARYIDSTDSVDFSKGVTWGDWLFSMGYNATYMVPSVIICAIILVIFNKVARRIYTVD
ncbi:MAG: energy-coupled thiamine transporter ThiT [Bacilli bacterium]|nr:energy-coupled thiamine transporter ThiT [Bacilli bacterium]